LEVLSGIFGELILVQEGSGKLILVFKSVEELIFGVQKRTGKVFNNVWQTNFSVKNMMN
jgi:hypothetical protein